MTTTFNWTISSLDRSLPDGMVLTAHWRCTGTDGDHSGSVYSTCSFPAKDISDPTFIPYDQLTEQQVLGWIWDGGVDKAATEAAVEAQINALKNPTQAAGVPWATTEVTTAE